MLIVFLVQKSDPGDNQYGPPPADQGGAAAAPPPPLRPPSVAEGSGVIEGDGYAVALDLDALGDGYGFRKVRKELGVTAFGVNVITIPPGYETGKHLHEEQEELYFVHRGAIEMTFGDGTVTPHRGGRLGPGRRLDGPRRCKNASTSEDAVYLVAGGKDGYVGRDGKQPRGRSAEPPSGAGLTPVR